ncbi:PASTA domain-containing protein [Corynebacterium xerosis]|uniref:non-specific serine/threonine protein kinase n=1 Tax=Corynebacterium xerosis TaxID=1725 RepID=A0A6B8TLM3_9CORY|nr:PASTA domain-containing protein [Corynebacterium xerosis]QGS33701.1 PASTA domain-containing protein [Corynebacterium xerosis]
MAEVSEGDVLDGRYRIGPLIARGGMSSVHRATDLRLGRDIAAKVMDPRFVHDESFRVRFEREARAVARMADESLVNVYDQGSDPAGHVFLIMELVDGGTLRELLRERGPMPPHAAAAVLRPVLRALSLAHERSMVHRDIKPENVLISDSGKVKLADFGLVRAAADSKVTSNSVIVGTVGYLSPEQVTGAEVTPASDVYSTGVLLYELLTGTTPFSGDSSLAVALQRLNKDVPPPSEVIDGVPPEFDDLVAHACAREPGDRFASAAEFSAELDDVIDELRLPPFRVPAPVDSAAHRASHTRDDLDAPDPEDVRGTELFDGPPQPGLFGPHGRDGTNETRHDLPAAPLPLPGTFASPDPGEGYGEDYGDHADDPHGYGGAYDDRDDFAARPDATSVLPGVVPGAPGAVPGMPPGMPGQPPYRADVPAPRHAAPDHGDGGHDGHGERGATAARRQAGARDGRQRTRTGCAIWLIVALIATLGMGLGAWWLGSGRYGEVPSISGMTEQQAAAVVSEAGFDPVASQQYHDAVPQAQIIGTEPLAGTRAVKGAAVTVVVSLGRPTVPALPTDRSASRFSTMLRERTLVEATGDPMYSDSVPRGAILMTEPASGETVATGSTVTVHLSKGQAPVKVPDVVGLDVDDVRRVLEESGLTVAEVTEVFSADDDADAVLAITPEPGTGLARGSDVTLTVNNGIEIPDVSGLTIAEAREKLTAAGIAVRDVAETDDSPREAGQVDSTSPAAGDLVEPNNATVDLKVSNRVEVPNILGAKISDARDRLEESGLMLKISGDASDNDRVYTQSPRSGSDAKRGDEVTVRGF